MEERNPTRFNDSEADRSARTVVKEVPSHIFAEVEMLERHGFDDMHGGGQTQLASNYAVLVRHAVQSELSTPMQPKNVEDGIVMTNNKSQLSNCEDQANAREVESELVDKDSPDTESHHLWYEVAPYPSDTLQEDIFDAGEGSSRWEMETYPIRLNDSKADQSARMVVETFEQQKDEFDLVWDAYNTFMQYRYQTQDKSKSAKFDAEFKELMAKHAVYCELNALEVESELVDRDSPDTESHHPWYEVAPYPSDTLPEDIFDAGEGSSEGWEMESNDSKTDQSARMAVETLEQKMEEFHLAWDSFNMFMKYGYLTVDESIYARYDAEFKELMAKHAVYTELNAPEVESELVDKDSPDTEHQLEEVAPYPSGTLQEDIFNAGKGSTERKNEIRSKNVKGHARNVKTPNSSPERAPAESSEPQKNPLTCWVCGQEFKNMFNLTRHLRSHTGAKPFKCKSCDRSFTRKMTLIEHSNKHTGKNPHSCVVCGATFPYKNSLVAHLKSHTKKNAQKQNRYPCRVCKESFNVYSDLSKHLRANEGCKPHKCSVCQKRFSFESTLNVHFKTHSQEKPFQCDKCLKTFARKDQIRRHLDTHIRKAIALQAKRKSNGLPAERKGRCLNNLFV